MGSVKSDKSKSVIDTSLTELAFVFFFVLLAFSALKFKELNENSSEQQNQLENLQLIIDQQEETEAQVVETLLPIRKAVNEPIIVDADAIFDGLDQTKDAVLKIAEEREDLLQIVDQIFEASTTPAQIVEAIEKIKEIADDKNSSILESLMSIETQLTDLRGQNINLRNKIEAIGNGLDHPPCWADPVSGEIEYVYEITINEKSIIVNAGWPDSRNDSVELYPFIAEAIGEYMTQGVFLTATKELYELSEEMDCRHFVKVTDNAVSKDAFKFYLLTIERHFYKLLL